MNTQVVEAMKHLKAGSMYMFTHSRKGMFVARYKGLVEAKIGDPQDEYFIDVDIYTADGSGQERLANTFVRDDMGRKVRPEWEGRHIRPSLLSNISTPNNTAQEQLKKQFAAANEKALARTDVDTSVLPFPTEKAVSLLTPDPVTTNPIAVKVALGGMAASAAVAAVAHLLGVL